MNEEKAREMLKELCERHKVSEIPIKFYPNPIIEKKELIIDLGGATTHREITNASFNLNQMTGECWIEFYGLPTKTHVRHEFKHYLDHLGIEYIRKRPKKEGCLMTELEGLWRIAIILAIQTIVIIFGFWSIDHTLDKILRKLEADR